MIRWMMGACLLLALGCGGGSGSASCGADESCDVPNDNGVHSCYDVMLGPVTLAKANMECTGSPTNGTILSACCTHASAVGRCVFQPTEGGTSTEWFLSGTAASAQSTCASKGGTFTAM